MRKQDLFEVESIMNGCQGCQDKLLEHLYDLLDEAEQRELQAHLAGCPTCEQALEAARAQQKLLAAAARLEFPAVTFRPPAGEVRPVLLPVRPHLSKPRPWRRWALAAAVLLLVAGAGVPAGLACRDYLAARGVVARQQEEMADARRHIDETTRRMSVVAEERDRSIAKVQHDIRARELRMEVQGPHSVQAGVAADYQVRTVDLNGNPTAATITAHLAAHGKADRSLEVRELQQGLYKVSIPPSLRLEPAQGLGMVVEARRKNAVDKRLALRGTMRLTQPVYLTHLTTDKPMYQPGEIVRFRSLTVDRSTLRPAEADFRFVFTLADPLNTTTPLLAGGNALNRMDAKGLAHAVNGPDGKPIKGVAAGEVPLDPAAAGGEYTLTVSDQLGRFTPVTRKFLVNRYQVPRLDKKLDFSRSSYGPGDQVRARVRAHRADGGAVKNSPVEITVTVDDQVIGRDGTPTGKPFPEHTDVNGEVVASFTLPAAIERGQASLAVKFVDGAVVETIVRPIPVVLKKLNVEFFPEGGDLVAGLPNRVYFQARTPLGKPAQVEASLLEDGQVLPGKIATLADDRLPGVNQGNGVFAFTPRQGRTYELRIDSPAGITQRVKLPTAKDDGVVLSVPGGVYDADQPIRVEVRTTRPRTLRVAAYCRGRLLDTVGLEKDQTEAVLTPAAGTGGVCRITVFEEMPGGDVQRNLRPVAERLVYRHPRERVDVAIAPDRRRYAPGEKVTLSLLATDEKEKLTSAIVLVCVVDKSVLTMADEKTARSMPTHLLLTTEVQRADDLEYADFLVGQHPKAPQALDLLLGTQGWRRFAEVAPERFRDRLVQAGRVLSVTERQRQAEEAERLLVLIGQSSPRRTDFDEDKIERALASYHKTTNELQKEQAEARQKVKQAGEDSEYRAALARIAWYQDLLSQSRAVAVPALTVLALLLSLLCLVQAARRNTGRAWLAGLATAATIVAVVFLGQGVIRLHHEDRKEERQLAQAMVEREEVTRQRARQAKDRDKGDRPMVGDEKEKAAPMEGNPEAMTAPVPPGAAGGRATDVTAGKATAAMKKPAGDQGGVRFRAAFSPDGKKAAEAKGGRGEMALADARRDLRKGNRNFNLWAQKKDLDGDAKPGGPPGGAGGFGGGVPAPGYFARNFPGGGPGRGPMAGGGAGIGGGPFGGGFGGRGLMFATKDKEAGWPPLPPLVVREYSHHHPTPVGNVRADFTETVYWHPVLVLPDGKAEVSFDLCDSVTSFEVTAFAHTLDGRLGAATKRIESRLPFTLSPRVPVEVTATDRVDVPLAIANNSPESRPVYVRLTGHDGLKLAGGEREARLDLPADGRARRLFSFTPSLVEGNAEVRFEGTSSPFADAIRVPLRVVPDGFPVAGSSSDLLEGSATHRLRLPAWIPGTLQVKVDVYPSTLADLQKGLASLLREPCGCFEQSSTANYPNVLILDYLKTSDQADVQAEAQARQMLDRGYRKLTSFECQEPGANRRRGYEWFGGTAPPHEALTAYGLLQFRDMARVHDVDPAMLKRTAQYLLAQRDGKGGFQRNPRSIDTFGRAPQHVTDAYIVWALTESGKEEDLTVELDALAAQAKKSEDPYFLSLVALGLVNRARATEAEAVLRRVAKMQKSDGHLEARETSITGSGGRDLWIETTALAVLGWLKTNAAGFDPAIRPAVRWIGQQRGAFGGFGSTQSTILALKALIAHTRANKRTPEAGVLRLFVGDKKLAEGSFPAGVNQPLTLVLPDAEKHLKAGDNRLRVEITGKQNVFPHTLSWTYRTAKPDSAARPPVTLETSLARTALTEGDAVRLRVKVHNASGAGQGMAVAIVGLPAGLVLPEDLKQLKEHCRLPSGGERPLVSAFEVRGREVVLYWRDLALEQTIEVPLDLVARVPGKYRGPASRAYLYYNADVRHWIEPLAVSIKAAP